MYKVFKTQFFKVIYGFEIEYLILENSRHFKAEL